MRKKVSEIEKTHRILEVHNRLIQGECLRKKDLAAIYDVNERTIQRDIETIRAYYENKKTADGSNKEVVYDRVKRGYVLHGHKSSKLLTKEILVICKILLSSRAFTKEEAIDLLQKLIKCADPKEQRILKNLISNEEFNYASLQHKKPLVDEVWKLADAVNNQQRVAITYNKMDGTTVKRTVEPVGLLFSEYYFYLLAYYVREGGKKIHYEKPPTIYRIDRIKSSKVLEEHFSIPYKDRFQEGEFRKKIQYMYGGRMKKVKFRFTGDSIEAVLDKLPTARILSEENGAYILQAEVFGEGIYMWLGSQGEHVEILE